MQLVSVDFVGYTSTDDLVVVRGGPSNYQVFMGTGKDPMDNIFQQHRDEVTPANEQYGLCAKRTERVIELAGGRQLVNRTFGMGGEALLYDGRAIPQLPGRHFTFLQDQNGQLHVSRQDREVKFAGKLEERGNITRLVVTGVRDFDDWHRSAEVFVAPMTHSPGITGSRRLSVHEYKGGAEHFVLVTEFGRLTYQVTSRFMRGSDVEYFWNNHLLKPIAPVRFAIRNEEGMIY